MIKPDASRFRASLPLIVRHLPVVPRLLKQFAGNLAKVELVSVALNFKFNEVHAFARRNGMDANYLRRVPHHSLLWRMKARMARLTARTL